MLDGSAPDHRLPGTVFAFRSSSVTAALRYGRLHSTRRNADRSRVPLLPPTAKRVGTVWHTVPRGLEGSAPLAMLASHVPHLLRRPPEASIAPPFIASPFGKLSYTVPGSIAFTASHSPPLGDAILPSTVRYFIVSRSSSGLLEAPHPAATCRASTEKWVSQREPSFPSAFFLRTPGSLLLLARRHFFSRKNGFSSSFFLSTTSESTPVKTWRGFHMRSEA